jgi:two-component system, chemotaxis family, protein-glutamate methylesterase/glutaminase
VNPIKVLVIDDSAFMRKMISDILNSDPSIKVVATARNGKDGIEKVIEFTPDVVTMDIEMPVMDGIEALKVIMEERPVPVVMLSSLTQSGAESTINALNYGAVDFIAKPSGPISLDIANHKNQIISKVRQAARVNVKMLIEPDNGRKSVKTINYTPKQDYSNRKKIVGVGVSTGGPRALEKLLTKLPDDFPAPLLIVQHMPARFTKSLADRLNKLTNITVKEAEHGELLQKGTAYIAPGDYHLKIKSMGTALTVFLEKSDPVKGHRPSVDILFQSIAELTNYQKCALILTGMGSDGSDGIKSLKESDPKTIILAESEESSIVFGMPKSAIYTNLVDHVVHIKEMGQALSEIIGKRGDL